MAKSPMYLRAKRVGGAGVGGDHSRGGGWMGVGQADLGQGRGQRAFGHRG